MFFLEEINFLKAIIDRFFAQKGVRFEIVIICDDRNNDRIFVYTI